MPLPDLRHREERLRNLHVLPMVGLVRVLRLYNVAFLVTIAGGSSLFLSHCNDRPHLAESFLRKVVLSSQLGNGPIERSLSWRLTAPRATTEHAAHFGAHLQLKARSTGRVANFKREC